MAAFPATELPAVTELLINGAWTSALVRVQDGVQITRGRANESAKVSPTRLNATLDNTDGRYSNRLPTSLYYGLIGRNTQLRHRLRWVYDTFTRTVSSGLGSEESPGAYAWTILSGLASDWNVSSVTGLATVLCSAASISRSARVGPVLADARTTGLVKPTVVATGAPIDLGYMLRRDNATDTYYEALVRFEVGGTMRVRVNKVIAGAATNIQEADLSGTYTAATLMWLVADVKGDRIRVRAWDSTSSEPTTWHLDFTDSSVTAPGQFGGLRIRVQAGNTNVPFSPGWSSVDVSDYRFWGEVPAWPQTWDRSGRDVTAPIEAAGIMRRLTAGAKPLRSAMYRTMAGIAANDYQPHAYWPLEDGPQATQFGSAVPGVPPLSAPGGTTLATDQTLAGSDPLPTLAAGAVLRFAIPPYSNAGQCVVQWLMAVPSEPAAEQTLAEMESSSGPIRLWRITVAPGAPSTVWIYAFDAAGAAVNSPLGIPLTGSNNDNPSEADFYGHMIMFTFAPKQVAADINSWFGICSGPPGEGVAGANSDTGTLGAITGGRLFGGPSGVGVGHLAVYVDPNFSVGFGGGSSNNIAAMSGYSGETAAERMARLCREESIYFEITGDADSTALVGPQQRDTLLNVLQAAAEVDGGILHEPRDNLGLAYRTLGSLYNQSGLTLDYSASQVFEPFRPTEDDQLIVNDATARRTDGSFARVVVTSGSLSTQDPPDGVGTYDEDRSYNANTDDQLPNLASWRTNIGSWDEARFPQVHAKLHAPGYTSSASLTGQVAALDVGDYLSVTNPPAWLPPDDIRLLALGYRETHRSFEWDITYNTVPAGPYVVGVYNDTVRRYDSQYTTTAEVLDTTETGVDIQVASGRRGWVTTAGQPAAFPFDISVGGERMRVTACTSTGTGTYTFTVTRSVNGVVKSHATGASVRLWTPARYAK